MFQIRWVLKCQSNVFHRKRINCTNLQLVSNTIFIYVTDSGMGIVNRTEVGDLKVA